jgi:hypothetical protein
VEPNRVSPVDGSLGVPELWTVTVEGVSHLCRQNHTIDKSKDVGEW